MDVYRHYYDQNNSKEIFPIKRKKAANKLSEICLNKCVNLAKESLSENEQKCFTNCQIKLFGTVVPLYYSKFGYS